MTTRKFWIFAMALSVLAIALDSTGFVRASDMIFGFVVAMILVWIIAI